MDNRERMNDLLVAFLAGFKSWQAGIWTAMPGILQSFNAAAMTCEVQAAIQAQIKTPTGLWLNTTISVCEDVPVIFPGGGDFFLSFPLVAGNEGLIVFAQRCIDAWWQQGGVQNQAELRMHDPSDGFFIPGCFSQPRVPAGISTTSTRLSNKDGTTYVELEGGNVINVAAPGGCNFLGPVVFEEGVVFEGTVSGRAGGGGVVNFGNAKILTTGDIQSEGIASHAAHEHSNGDGGANTGPPTG